MGSWVGRKYEERYTRIYLLLWQDLAASHAFFTSPAYKEFNDAIQPAMNGRKITWNQHALLDVSSLASKDHFESILSSPAVEIAWTKVVEGGVAGYYERFNETVAPILDEDPGCDGYFISPQIEDPQSQVLLINWKSVDVRISKVLSDGNYCAKSISRLTMRNSKRSQGSGRASMPCSIIIGNLLCHGILLI